MIYNYKLCQSINETNQESKYLQLCRSKAYCQSRIHCLLEAACDLTFKLYKTPSGCCMSFASQVRATTEHAQNTGYLSKILPGLFHYLPHCDQNAAMWPTRRNVTNMTQCDQHNAMWPIWRNVTIMTQCDQHGAMWPSWHNVTNMAQCDQNFLAQWFCVYTCLLMNYSIAKAWIVVYISRNSSMSSLSSSVKITSQQFSCVCRILICGISHEFSAACSSTVREIPAVLISQPSWPILSQLPLESVLLQWFLPIYYFSPFCHVIHWLYTWTITQ